MVGQAGLELQYNRELMGQDGLRRIIVNSRGVEVMEAERVDPKDGPRATLTLDLELQKAFEEAMGGQSGSVIALEPRTGEVLAYISSPGYDPNSFSAGIKPEEWGRLTRDPEKPLINRVIQGQYPPGSTFKVLSALAALQEGVITPQTRFHCPGYLAVYGTMFRCHQGGPHATVDLKRALALSCNVYFYNVGIRLEIERLSRYAKLLGLARPTGIDLPHEAAGIFQDPDWKMRTQKVRWFPAETVSVSIGQAMAVTPIQLARVASVVGERRTAPGAAPDEGGGRARGAGVPAERPRVPGRRGGHRRRRDARRRRGGHGHAREAGGRGGGREDGIGAGGDPRPPGGEQERARLSAARLVHGLRRARQRQAGRGGGRPRRARRGRGHVRRARGRPRARALLRRARPSAREWSRPTSCPPTRRRCARRPRRAPLRVGEATSRRSEATTLEERRALHARGAE